MVENDNIIENCERELKEETGYKLKKIIKIVDDIPVAYSDAGVTSSSGKLVLVEIDLDDPDN